MNLRLLLAAIILTLAVDGVVRHLLSHTEVRILPAHIAQITAGGNLMASFQYEENLAASDSDGVRLFASALRNGGAQLEAISLSDGTATDVSVPREVVNPVLGAVSPDGSRIVVRSQLSRESEQPLWIIPTMGGSAQRVGNVRAHDASWMPDGRILYATGDELYVDSLSDTEPQLYAKLPGRAYWMRWAPDGSLLRFTIIDPITHRFSLWQISPSDRKAKLVLPDWDKLRFSNCCGMWTADGKSFVFQSAQQEETDLWRLSTKALSAPVRLTDGPLHFKEPVAGRSGNRIYFLGTDPRATIECYTGFRHERLPEGWLEQAVRITYSHDGQWVAWTTVDGSLWRSRIDGSERLQLTPPDMKVFLADWSPDSSRLALMARKPDQAWHVYLLPSSGGLPQLAFDDGFNVGDPSWGPDGQTLVFGRLNGVMGKDSKVRRLQILDLRNGHIETVPGSDGLYSPRWSPDGRYIAALSLDSRKVMLFSVANRLWVRLPLSSGADPHWSADSRSLYVHEFAAPNQLIVRIGIPGARIEGALNLVAPEEHTALEFTFSGVTPSGDILVRTRTNSANLYTMTIANSPEK